MVNKNDIYTGHYAEMKRIGRDRAARENLKARQKQTAAKAARRPEAVKQIDFQLDRIDYLLMAAKLVDGPGSFFKKFAAIAGPAAIIPERLCDLKNWRIEQPFHWSEPDEFLTWFGFPPDPALSTNTCGLHEGHLFAADSNHNGADLIAYVDQWVVELEAQRAEIYKEAVVTTDMANGVTQDFGPGWV